MARIHCSPGCRAEGTSRAEGTAPSPLTVTQGCPVGRHPAHESITAMDKDCISLSVYSMRDWLVFEAFPLSKPRNGALLPGASDDGGATVPGVCMPPSPPSHKEDDRILLFILSKYWRWPEAAVAGSCPPPFSRPVAAAGVSAAGRDGACAACGACRVPALSGRESVVAARCSLIRCSVSFPPLFSFPFHPHPHPPSQSPPASRCILGHPIFLAVSLVRGWAAVGGTHRSPDRGVVTHRRGRPAGIPAPPHFYSC